jgi:hypothetical protein
MRLGPKSSRRKPRTSACTPARTTRCALEVHTPADYKKQTSGVWRSWLARFLHTEEVTGSSPVTPTESVSAAAVCRPKPLLSLEFWQARASGSDRDCRLIASRSLIRCAARSGSCKPLEVVVAHLQGMLLGDLHIVAESLLPSHSRSG